MQAKIRLWRVYLWGKLGDFFDAIAVAAYKRWRAAREEFPPLTSDSDA
ncbi:MAG: hypothetical protein LBQ81_12335 [Zoogloeaceae bacterium]|nr:hypothetical protein [Zoogloeaceae bacterium]